VKRLGFAALLFGVACLVALGLAELALRALNLAPTRGLTTLTAAQFDRLPGLFSPGAEFVDLRNRALPHQVRIDSLGFRGPDFARQRDSNAVRIVMLGDSFIYGDFVNNDETLPFVLERRLNDRCGKVEVINAGLPGSTISDQVEVARRVLALGPTLVIISFTENDVTDLANEPMWSMLARNRAAKSGFPLRFLYPALRGSALWNLAMQVRGRLRTAQRHDAGDALPATAGQQGGVRPDSARRAAYDAALTTLVAELSRAAVPAAFVTFPAHFTVYREWSEEQLLWVEARAQAQGLPVVSTLSALRASGKSATELFLLPHDGHPSALGYSIAADTLARELRALEPLAARCGPTS
jgi:lysophospholipase L1-like esterase